MADYVVKIGQKIRARREQLGLSQGELATRALTSQRTVSQIENAEVSTNLDILCRVAKALQLLPEQLLGVAEEHDVTECYRRVGVALDAKKAISVEDALDVLDAVLPEQGRAELANVLRLRVK